MAHSWATGDVTPASGYGRHPVAISRAAQISIIRLSARRPNRSMRMPAETLSTKSRLTAERRGTGSSSGSRTTSVASPLIVVVQGATRVRRNRGMAASRDRTTTGRLPMSGGSHHHISPRAGSGLTTRPRTPGTTLGRPSHRARQAGVRRNRHSSRQLLPPGSPRARLPRPRRSGRSPAFPDEGAERSVVALRRQSYSRALVRCHNYAITMPHRQALRSRAGCRISGPTTPARIPRPDVPPTAGSAARSERPASATR